MSILSIVMYISRFLDKDIYRIKNFLFEILIIIPFVIITSIYNHWVYKKEKHPKPNKLSKQSL